MRLIDADSLKENLSKWLKQVDSTHPSDIPPMDDIIVSTIMTIEEEPTVEAIPIGFIKCLYKEAIEYRNRWPIWSLAWRRGDEQAIGIDSVLQVWEDRNE